MGTVLQTTVIVISEKIKEERNKNSYVSMDKGKVITPRKHNFSSVIYNNAIFF